jgi:hypothetical protein
MLSQRVGTWVLASALALVGCGDEKPREEGTQPGSGGSAGSGGSTAGGGAGGTGGPAGRGGGIGSGGTIVVPGGYGGIGAFAGNMVVDPPDTVDLEACSSVVDDGSTDADGACWECCVTRGFDNYAHFAGTCACSKPVNANGASVCASEQQSQSCFSCCFDADYSGSDFDANVAGSCVCSQHRTLDLCPSSVSDPMAQNACAVCCINAGYISSAPAGNACVCSDG